VISRTTVTRALIAGLAVLTVGGCGTGATTATPTPDAGAQAISALAGATTYTLPLASDAATSLADGLKLAVSIGGGADRDMEVDTGSRGIVVARSAIGSGATDTGQAGSVEYTSDGLILSGEYFMAAVTFHTASSTVATIPIRVLGVESSSCDSAYPRCTPDASVKNVGMLGVGYGEYAKTQLPAAEDNPFLELTAMRDGAVRRGYVITRNGVTLGATAADLFSFHQVALRTPGSADGPAGQPGTWGPAPGCFVLPGFSTTVHCGTILMDSGIGTMIVGLASADRPASIASAIPDGTVIKVDVPAAASPALGYTATIGSAADAIAPQGNPAARWAGSGPFVNTGRHVLAGYDYLFDASTGHIGFRADPA